jgi:hypothetical protein
MDVVVKKKSFFRDKIAKIEVFFKIDTAPVGGKKTAPRERGGRKTVLYAYRVTLQPPVGP